MLRAVTALVLLAGALVCPAVWGSDYFVSPQGDDGNPGTAGQPWKTLARPNAAAVSGDTVTFAPGEYEGAVSPQNSGRPGAPITLRSARPLAAVLRGVKGGPAVSLIQKQHVVLEGFSIHPADGWWAAIRECEGITLRGCRMEEARGSYTAFHVTQSKGTRLLGNVFTRQVSLRKGLILNGDMLTVDHSDRTVVEGNDFSKAGHGPATWLLTTNDVIRSNLFHAEWGRNFSLFNCSPVLFEHNVAIENYHGSASADTGSKILTIDGIVRRNLLARNWGYVIHSFGYTYGQFPPWVLTGTRIYHNTFANNASFAWGISSATRDGSGIRGNVWKNNVFSRHTPASPARTFLISGVIGDDNLWANNLIWGGRAGAETIWRWDAGARGQLALPLERAEKQFQSEWRGNLDADPLFADEERDDYTLRRGSPCIDRGEFLATAVEAGSGTTVKVTDARWFYDGFGIAGEQGDLVVVGPKRQTARVLRVDREANTLTLARPLRWAAGDPVSLPYTGSAPDLGAMEYGAGRDPWFRRLAVPAGLRWRPPSPTAPLVLTNFEDADIETWAACWYWGRFDLDGSTEPERVTDTAGAGKSCARVRAEKDGARMDVSIAPRAWEVDRYPWIRFHCRIPPGVPVGVRLETFPVSVIAGERTAVVAGSPACLAAGKFENEPAVLQDDDQWHLVTLDARAIRKALPDTKVLYALRFFSPVPFKQGQQFWFDDFAVLPARGVAQ